MTHNNWDKYLDPPDDPEEEEYCEECGKAMDAEKDIFGDFELSCKNRFCPSKQNGIAKEMAEYIVELLDDLETRKTKIKQLERKITALEFYRDENGG